MEYLHSSSARSFSIQSESRSMNKIWLSTVSSPDNRQASRSSPLGQVVRLVARSMMQEERSQLVAFVSSALHPNFSSQFLCSRRPTPSQALNSAATTNSASPLLRALVDCFLLDAVIGYQPSLPCTHDVFPLTLNRSASPAQSESSYVSTEPSAALVTASRLSVVGGTAMIPGFPRRNRRIDLMFLISVSLARRGLDEAFLHRTTTVSSVNAWKFSNELSVNSLLACRHLLLTRLTAFPSQCWCALERGHVELLQHAFHVCSINSEIVLLLRFHQGSSQVACWFHRHLAALELQVPAQIQ